MRKEMKICLPLYKLVYSLFFAAVLCVIRGVGFTVEIGIALEPPMALLAAVFCSDTYVQEITSGRSEVERLYPLKKRIASVGKRVLLQDLYLFLLAILSYGLFYVFQNPVPFYSGELSWMERESGLFIVYAAEILVTLVFWSVLALVVSSLARSMWAGIGASLLLWVGVNSTTGERLFGKWNLFSYVFRDIENAGDFSWVWGKILSVVLCVAMAVLLPKIIQKRG